MKYWREKLIKIISPTNPIIFPVFFHVPFDTDLNFTILIMHNTERKQ